MSILFKKDTKITHVITNSVERSKALGDEARATILTILSHKPLSTENIVKELKKAGYQKATTKVRHHLDILKDCGLIEVVRVQEVRGAVLKSYAATAKYLGFENSFDLNKYNRVINQTAIKLLKITNSVVDSCGITLRNTTGLTCTYCNMQHGREYTVIEIMNRALAEMIQKREFIDMMKKPSSKEKAKK